MAKPTDITPERVRELFDYNPETGILTQKIRTSQRVRVGDVVGRLNSAGHLVVTVAYKHYLAHVLIWLSMTGEWPKNEIDHWDMDGSNNRWLNLRPATKSQNGTNRHRMPNNRIGLKGVSWCGPMKKFRARIHVNFKEVTLGYFDDPKDAYIAYCDGARKHYGEFARFE